MDNRIRVAAYVKKDLIDWIDGKVREGRFRSRSHGIEESIITKKQLMEGSLLK